MDEHGIIRADVAQHAVDVAKAEADVLLDLGQETERLFTRAHSLGGVIAAGVGLVLVHREAQKQGVTLGVQDITALLRLINDRADERRL